MADAAAHLPRFNRRATDIFDLTRQIRPLGNGDPPPAPPPDRIAEAEARGRDAAEAAAAAELMRIRAEDAATFDARLAAARKTWVEDTAAGLSASIAAGIEGIANSLGDSVARVLAPFVAKAVRERALDELAETVLALLHGGRHVAFRLRGPRDLVGRLSEALAAFPHALEPADDGADLRVTIDDMAVDTEIAAWVARIEDAAGAAHG
jgi:hypothetical protein